MVLFCCEWVTFPVAPLLVMERRVGQGVVGLHVSVILIRVVVGARTIDRLGSVGIVDVVSVNDVR